MPVSSTYIIKYYSLILEKFKKYGDKLHTLIDNLGWEYQRMGRCGRETYDEICHLLNMIPEDEVYMEID